MEKCSNYSQVGFEVDCHYYLD